MSIADFLKKKKDTQAAENKQAGLDFLAGNKNKEGITTTDSGLQYELMNEGNGQRPNAHSKVTCHYEGRLLSGKVFDSSLERGQPATFPLDRVIPGWTEGLQYMKEGAKYRFFIPEHLAYGANQVGTIPPCSTLIFEVELLKID